MIVSVIIVNYNTESALLKCIKSIFKFTKDVDFEIVIVDNASVDNSEIVIKKYYPQISYIKLPKNIGFGQANNKGIEIAVGKFIFLLNSDTIFLNNALKVFLEFMNTHKNVKIGAIGGQLLQADEVSKNHSYSLFPTFLSEYKIELNRIYRAIFKKNIFNKLNEVHLLESENYKSVDYITGAAILIPKNVLNEIGNFDPQFFMYYEETDLQKRMSNAGFKRLIINGTKIIHLEGGSFNMNKKISGLRLLMIEESKFKYLKKHKNILVYFVFRFFYFFTSIPLFFKVSIPFHYRIKLLKLRIGLGYY